MIKDMNTILAIHLQYNHYPPVTLEMIGPCKQAIDYCNKGLSDNTVLCGTDWIPAWEIVEDLNLGEWLTEGDE